MTMFPEEALDVDGDGVREPIAWTRAGSRAAFLVLDLDSDGAITTGAELFGVPVGARRRHRPAAGENSFTLLAAYDDPANGGNGDGAIGTADVVFSRLRLWIDTNHDGVSQPGELVSLTAAGIQSIELAYQVRGRRDGQGNFYRYRGVVHLTSGRRVPIWDVFLATGSGTGGAPDAAEGGTSLDDGSASGTMSLEGAGPGLGGDGDFVATPGSAVRDETPTPLQVVEYYHLDALGSVRAVTDADGQVIARHDFLPFGEEIAPQSPPRDRRLFTGQERDFETGLDYFHARQLRVDLGRFTAPDPLTDLAWTDPTLGATNAYSYVHHNPLGFIDPTGAGGDQVTATMGCTSVNGGPKTCYATALLIADPSQQWYLHLVMGWDFSFDGGGDSYPSNGLAGGGVAANNGRNCTVATASAEQYAAAAAQMAAMTAAFFSGLGPGNLTFGPSSATSQVMAQSGPVQEVLNSYFATGKKSDLYTFGLHGLASAGANPVAQFVGSFRWNITSLNGGISLSLTNTSSFKSLSYGVGPQWQRGSWPTPMGNTHQTYIITVKCK